MMYFTWLISLLWFVTIDYHDHHLDFLKIMNQHPVSKTRFKGFAGETEVQKKWEQILVSSWGWVVSPTIYTGFSDASDASRLPGGWEQPSWNRHQWIASFPKVVKYWPAKSHLQQTWGGVRHYFIHQHLQRYRSFSATFLTWHATCPSYSHLDPKNNHHRSYHKSFQTHEFWCIKNHPMDFLLQHLPKVIHFQATKRRQLSLISRLPSWINKALWHLLPSKRRRWWTKCLVLCDCKLKESSVDGRWGIQPPW